MQLYGILAYPAKHSLSPVVQNAAFKEMKIDAQFNIFEIPPEGLDKFMKYVKHEPVMGLSVSSPHKETIMRYLDEIDENARKIGAVNTVVKEIGLRKKHERLKGYNTDYIGATRALTETIGDLKDKKVIVIGAGGACRAVCYGLLKEGAVVSIFNRTKEKAEKIANDFLKIFPKYSEIITGDLSDILKADGEILVQTTSIWLENPDAKITELIPADFLKKFNVVMDIVYKPLITPLLKAAKDLGETIITGDKMFLYQAIEQFKLWTGEEAPVDVMKKTLNDNLASVT